MLTRRHIRLKVMQIIYALRISDFEYTKETEKNLLDSIDSMYDLYLILISLLVELLKKAETKFLISKQKLLTDNNNHFDNQKIIKNQLLNYFKTNSLFNQEIKNRSLNVWEVDFKYVDLIYDQLIKSDFYSEYLTSSELSFKNDKNFVSKLYKDIMPKILRENIIGLIIFLVIVIWFNYVLTNALHQNDGNKNKIDGGKVAFFSLEMSAEQLATRVLAQESKISGDKMRKAELSKDDFKKIAKVSSELENLCGLLLN